jgi:hypothetical protein
MKSPSTLTPRRSRGSSLVETLLAVGLLGALFPPLFGLLVLGLASIQRTGDAVIHTLLVPKIQQQLIDSSWPSNRSAGRGGDEGLGSWKANLHFDDALRPTEQPGNGVYRVELSGSPGLGWQSDSLEAVRMRVFRDHGDVLVGSCVLQRHRSRVPMR